MPLNLDSENGSSQFYDKLRFNAQGGVWFQKREDDEVRFNDGFVAVFDMEMLQTGWSRFNGSFLDFIPDPSLDTQGERPIDDADASEDKWKRSFKVLAYSDKAFGGVVEFMHQARTVTTAFQELYAEYENKAGNGKLPVIEVSGTPKKVGDYYAPSWSIKKMIERPDALSENAQAVAEPAADDVEFA